MSQQRRKRQAKREQHGASKSDLWRSQRMRTILLVAIAIVMVFAGIYFFAVRKGDTRLDAFAQCLSDKQVKMYGLYWCEHCEQQKEMFGASFKHVNYVECGIKGSHDEEPICKTAGVKNFPTWEFPDGSRKEGAQPLTILSEKTTCKLP
jgi:uncharacterized protein YjeT (DUF2065 family)